MAPSIGQSISREPTTDLPRRPCSPTKKPSPPSPGVKIPECSPAEVPIAPFDSGIRNLAAKSVRSTASSARSPQSRSVQTTNGSPSPPLISASGYSGSAISLFSKPSTDTPDQSNPWHSTLAHGSSEPPAAMGASAYGTFAEESDMDKSKLATNLFLASLSLLAATTSPPVASTKFSVCGDCALLPNKPSSHQKPCRQSHWEPLNFRFKAHKEDEQWRYKTSSARLQPC